MMIFFVSAMMKIIKMLIAHLAEKMTWGYDRVVGNAKVKPKLTKGKSFLATQ